MLEEPPTIANRDEFRRLLRAGHGRIIRFLQTHDSTPYHDIILDVCLHHPAYDKQSEGTRGTYMVEVMEATGTPTIYRQHVLNALRDDPDDWDADHLCSIVRLFAEQGDEEARLALYEYVSTSISNGEDVGAEQIVALDGIEGFVYVATLLQRRQHPNHQPFYDSWYRFILEDVYGEEQAAEHLRHVAAQNEIVAAYLQAVALEQERQEQNRQRRAARPYEDYTVLQSYINDARGMSLRRHLIRWGRNATDTDLHRAATALLDAQDNAQLLKYLNVFRGRGWPLAPEPLITLTESDDESIVEAAYGALKEVAHPLVRAHALQLFGALQRPSEAVDLLRSNWHEGDQPLIERVLHEPLSEDDIHSIGLSVLDITESHVSKVDVRTLRLLYELDPCSECRSFVVDRLIEVNAMPEWMIDECRYDANTDIRGTIEQHYGEPEHLLDTLNTEDDG